MTDYPDSAIEAGVKALDAEIERRIQAGIFGKQDLEGLVRVVLAAAYPQQTGEHGLRDALASGGLSLIAKPKSPSGDAGRVFGEIRELRADRDRLQRRVKILEDDTNRDGFSVLHGPGGPDDRTVPLAQVNRKFDRLRREAGQREKMEREHALNDVPEIPDA